MPFSPYKLSEINVRNAEAVQRVLNSLEILHSVIENRVVSPEVRTQIASILVNILDTTQEVATLVNPRLQDVEELQSEMVGDEQPILLSIKDRVTELYNRKVIPKLLSRGAVVSVAMRAAQNYRRIYKSDPARDPKQGKVFCYTRTDYFDFIDSLILGKLKK